MKIQVKLYATLRRHIPNLELGEAKTFEVKEKATIEELIELLRIEKNEAKIILVNGVKKDLSYTMQENDLIVIFPPIGGG